MQTIDFRLPSSSHWGAFNNTIAWQQLCKVSGGISVADFNENKPTYFMQRLLIQSLILEGLPFKREEYQKKSLDYLLANKNLSLVILKYFLEEDTNLFKLNFINNAMLYIIETNSIILPKIHQEFNAYALQKKLAWDLKLKNNQRIINRKI